MQSNSRWIAAVRNVQKRLQACALDQDVPYYTAEHFAWLIDDTTETTPLGGVHQYMQRRTRAADIRQARVYQGCPPCKTDYIHV